VYEPVSGVLADVGEEVEAVVAVGGEEGYVAGAGEFVEDSAGEGFVIFLDVITGIVVVDVSGGGGLFVGSWGDDGRVSMVGRRHAYNASILLLHNNNTI